MKTGAALAACVLAFAAHAAGPPPAAVFFAHAARGHYRLSADGRRLAWLRRVAGADGRARADVFVQALRGVVPVGPARQLTHEAVRDIPDIAWKGDHTILFRRDAGGDEDFHVVALDADTGAQRDLTPGAHVRAALLDDLPDDPGHVLVASNLRDPARDDVWRVDVRSGEAELVAANPGDVTRWMTDHRGRVRLALRGDGLVLTWLHRADEEAPWTPLVSTDFRTDVTPRFFDADDRRLYALSNRGRDKEALVLIDPARPGDEQVLFEPAEVDAADAAWSRARRRLVRVDYVQDRPAHRFFDPDAERTWRRLEARLPGAAITLQDASADERKFVVAADDGRSPGTRWLYDARTDTLQPLGAVNPRLAPDRRTTAARVVYAARDGLAIHGILTLPAGRPARALACVVHPHGGPWTRDDVGWNAEVRFLASRGASRTRAGSRSSAPATAATPRSPVPRSRPASMRRRSTWPARSTSRPSSTSCRRMRRRSCPSWPR
jgi:dipeptidyl aminopeptidase/acylaminoacyl peptidase